MDDKVSIELPQDITVQPIYTQHPDMPRIGPPVPSSYILTFTEGQARDMMATLARLLGVQMREVKPRGLKELE